ncbi:uncharacterized protein At5g08430-like isoform X1 [Chenopodium quinoa]|uniref:uncharacterized protein At5g08430-like isoform X1 n=1 Tax=Chenopodium quinoa TaxID=63459 RepID=UPI000B78FA4C|nr:uncharacterized protein At5g08430-like isoform X1 [Chenopodium quinoa]XP_021734673.1 uncharacterized protein At5g08430-like isoform X1 [Chenopodium quinoa]
MDAYCEPTSFFWVEESKGQASTPRPRKKVKRKKEYVGWGSRELIAFLESMGKDCAKALSQYDVTNIINLYINDKKLVHPENKRRVVCDEKLFPLFEKKTIFRNKIHDLLESHFAENQEDSDDDNLGSSDEIDENGYSVPKKLKILTTQSKKKAPEVSKSCLAAINSDNIKLLYLRKSLVQELLNNPETFETKVVGSFVRVKSDPHDIFQKNSHQLQLVTGVKEDTPAGETKPSMLLQILGMTDVISISELSDDIFSEEEIEELRSRVKDGLLKQPTIGELEQKVVVLHEDITKHWLAKELVLLKNLIDRANEKGWRHRVREYLDRRKLLQSPDEQSRLLNEIPKVMAEEVKPELVSEPAPDDSPKAADWDWEPFNFSSTKKDVTKPEVLINQNGPAAAVAAEVSTRSNGDAHTYSPEERCQLGTGSLASVINLSAQSLEPKEREAPKVEAVNVKGNGNGNGYIEFSNLNHLGIPNGTKQESNGHIQLPNSKELKTIQPVVIDLSDSDEEQENPSVGTQIPRQRENPGVGARIPRPQENPGGGTQIPRQRENPGVGARIPRPQENPGGGTRIPRPQENPGVGARIPRPQENPGVGARILRPQENPGIGTQIPRPQENPGVGTEIPKPHAEQSLWHYLDPLGRVQGPFSLISLKRWSDANYFRPDFKVWANGQGPQQAVPLTLVLRHIFPN